MRASELIEDDGPSKLVQVLRTVIGSADAKGTPAFLHFQDPKEDEIRAGALNVNINKLMQNVGAPQFDYGTFKAAYDTDPRVKTMVADFNEKGIEPATAKTIDKKDSEADPDPESDKVGQMAKRATDLGDKL